MSTPKTKYPIESFGPELMAALIAGGRKVVTLEFKSKNMAHRFQMRVNMLRARMRELNHPDFKVASRARVSIYWGEKGGWPDDPDGKEHGKVIITPRDSEFGDALKDAKVKVEELANDPLEESYTPGTNEPEKFKDPLEDIQPKEKKNDNGR